MAQRGGPNLVQHVERLRQDDLLRRKVDKARPEVDTRPPAVSQLPPIGKQDHARKQAAVDAAVADRMMILNIAREMQRPSSLSNLNRKGPTSLNLDRRRKELRQIDAENAKMLKRLEGSKSSYQARDQKKSYNKSRSHAAIASHQYSYPSNIGARHSSLSRQSAGSSPQEFEDGDCGEGASSRAPSEPGSARRQDSNHLPALNPSGRASPSPGPAARGGARSRPPQPPQNRDRNGRPSPDANESPAIARPRDAPPRPPANRGPAAASRSRSQQPQRDVSPDAASSPDWSRDGGSPAQSPAPAKAAQGRGSPSPGRASRRASPGKSVSPAPLTRGSPGAIIFPAGFEGPPLQAKSPPPANAPTVFEGGKASALGAAAEEPAVSVAENPQSPPSLPANHSPSGIGSRGSPDDASPSQESPLARPTKEAAADHRCQGTSSPLPEQPSLSTTASPVKADDIASRSGSLNVQDVAVAKEKFSDPVTLGELAAEPVDSWPIGVGASAASCSLTAAHKPSLAVAASPTEGSGLSLNVPAVETTVIASPLQDAAVPAGSLGVVPKVASPVTSSSSKQSQSPLQAEAVSKTPIATEQAKVPSAAADLAKQMQNLLKADEGTSRPPAAADLKKQMQSLLKTDEVSSGPPAAAAETSTCKADAAPNNVAPGLNVSGVGSDNGTSSPPAADVPPGSLGVVPRVASPVTTSSSKQSQSPLPAVAASKEHVAIEQAQVHSDPPAAADLAKQMQNMFKADKGTSRPPAAVDLKKQMQNLFKTDDVTSGPPVAAVKISTGKADATSSNGVAATGSAGISLNVSGVGATNDASSSQSQRPAADLPGGSLGAVPRVASPVTSSWPKQGESPLQAADVSKGLAASEQAKVISGPPAAADLAKQMQNPFKADEEASRPPAAVDLKKQMQNLLKTDDVTAGPTFAADISIVRADATSNKAIASTAVAGIAGTGSSMRKLDVADADKSVVSETYEDEFCDYDDDFDEASQASEDIKDAQDDGKEARQAAAVAVPPRIRPGSSHSQRSVRSAGSGGSNPASPMSEASVSAGSGLEEDVDEIRSAHDSDED